MSKIRRVVVHIADDTDLSALAERVSQFHAVLIERRLKQSNLSVDQKIAVIDRIIKTLEENREVLAE